MFHDEVISICESYVKLQTLVKEWALSVNRLSSLVKCAVAFTLLNINVIAITIIFSYFVTINSFIMNLMLIFRQRRLLAMIVVNMMFDKVK